MEYEKLNTWGNRTTFKYRCLKIQSPMITVVQGYEIYFGKNNIQYLSQKDIDRIKNKFGGRTIVCGPAHSIPKDGSLEEWLMNNVSNGISIASYVAPLLIHLGYAEKYENDKTKIKFF